MLRALFGLLPYRCQQCGKRGWLRNRKYQNVLARRITAITIGVTVVALTSFVLSDRSPSIPTIESSSSDARDVQPATQSATPLRLRSATAHLSPAGNLWHIVGEVENVGDEALSNVQVVSIWLDKAGKVVGSRTDLVDLKRMMPGEVSTFTSVTQARPEMSTFRLEFQSETGQALPASTQ